MILLSEKIILKIDKLRFYNRLNTRIRLIFATIMSGWTWYTMQNNMFEMYSYTIVALLLTTFIINTVSDLLKSETENILYAIEYDKSKIKYERLDTKL
jgi:hypothetical protein